MTARPILFSGPMVRAILEGRKTQTRRVAKWPKIAARHDPDYDAHVIVDGWPWFFVHPGDGLNVEKKLACPYGRPGDRLWVKETHYQYGRWVKNGWTKSGRRAWKFKRLLARVYFPGDDLDGIGPARKRHENGWHKRPSIFMPHWASRILLEVVKVRVERLQDISEGDAAAEGVTPQSYHCTLSGGGSMKIQTHPDRPVPKLLGMEINVAIGPQTKKAAITAVEAQYVEAYAELWDSINDDPCSASKKARPFGWAQNPWVWVVEFRRVA